MLDRRCDLITHTRIRHTHVRYIHALTIVEIKRMTISTNQRAFLAEEPVCKNEYLERVVGRGGRKKKGKLDGNATSPVREWRMLTDVIWLLLCLK